MRGELTTFLFHFSCRRAQRIATGWCSCPFATPGPVSQKLAGAFTIRYVRLPLVPVELTIHPAFGHCLAAKQLFSLCAARRIHNLMLTIQLIRTFQSTRLINAHSSAAPPPQSGFVQPISLRDPPTHFRSRPSSLLGTAQRNLCIACNNLFQPTRGSRNKPGV
jgi:hypothetical protein